ncbi:hypothetical protein BC834DRAFT_66129 [Gloeopeniophorella convolvens]|nr:hypothetical protein BC834DRAFT_66129 [Gloeopeniophorella convolvens]
MIFVGEGLPAAPEDGTMLIEAEQPVNKDVIPQGGACTGESGGMNFNGPHDEGSEQLEDHEGFISDFDVFIGSDVIYDASEIDNLDGPQDDDSDEEDEDVVSKCFFEHKKALRVTRDEKGTRASVTIAQYVGTSRIGDPALVGKLFVHVPVFDGFMPSYELQRRLINNPADPTYLYRVYAADRNDPARVEAYNPKGVPFAAPRWKAETGRGSRLNSDQQARWWDIARGCSGKSSAYNVLARYWDREVPNITLYFTRDSSVDATLFESLVKDVITSHIKFKPTPVFLGEHSAWKKEAYPHQELIGTHFRNFYRVYIDTVDKPLIRHADYRPINETQFLNAIALVQPQGQAYALEERVNHHQWTTITQLNWQKLKNAKNKKRNPSQKSAMLSKSATLIADAFGWSAPGIQLPFGHAYRSEWLHRSAFSFGGLGQSEPQRIDPKTKAETPRVNTSQSPKNFIFGSVEANTLMLRPEMTIKRLIENIDDDASLTERKLGYGFTDPVVTGFVATTVKPFNFDPTRGTGFAEVDEDAPVNPTTGKKPLKYNYEYDEDTRQPENRCVWLAKSLDYSFFMRLSRPNGGEAEEICFQTSIDPFSRAVPLKLEAVLDEKLEKALFKLNEGRGHV